MEDWGFGMLGDWESTVETEDSGPRRHTIKSKTHFELRGNACLHLHTL